MRYLFDNYCLDTERYELHRGSVSIPLRPKVYQMLLYLLSHYDRVVLKEDSDVRDEAHRGNAQYSRKEMLD